MSKQLLIAICVSLLVGWLVRGWYEDGLELAVKKGQEVASQAAAGEIAKIEIKHVTINKRITEGLKDPSYESCRHNPEVWQAIQEMY